MSDCVCGRCEDPEDAELSALRAEVAKLRKVAEAARNWSAHSECWCTHECPCHAALDAALAGLGEPDA